MKQKMKLLLVWVIGLAVGHFLDTLIWDKPKK